MTEPRPWLADLPAGVDPETEQIGECPWARNAVAPPGWAHQHDGVFVVTDHADVKAVLSERRFKQGLHTRIQKQVAELDPRFVERRGDALLGREGPDHIRMRRIASKSAFTPKLANRHRPLMREVMSDLAEGIPPDGVCDVVELVRDYPTTVIAQVLGAEPDEVASFSTLVATIFDAQRGVPGAVRIAWETFEAFDARILALIDRKREHPDDDLVSDLVRAETEEGRLTTQDVHDIAVAVVMAGSETTRNALTRGIQLLAENPAAWAQLVDEDRLNAAVEEILRFAPLSPLRRVASEDLDVHGLAVPAGSVLILDIGVAHRDPGAFDDPHAFRPDRPRGSQHFALGHGHKYCLGANLARAELAEAFRVLRARYPRLELVGPPQWSFSGLPRATRMMARFGGS